MSGLLILVLLQLGCGYALDCFNCNGVQSTSDCHSITTCPTDHQCYVQSSTPSSTSTNSQPSPTTTCSKCCSKSRCNNLLCSSETPVADKCEDDPVFNCAYVSTSFNICADIQHAKSVCKRFCRLCDLVDGTWTDWGSWSACDTTCGNGTTTRTRTCTNPSPANGGADCVGVKKQIGACNLAECPIHGGWSGWSAWGSCSKTCNIGLQRRDRSCSNPYPERFGDHCFGDDKVYKSCFLQPCADGGWSDWSPWGPCTVSCNGGMKTRTRACDNPSPSQFGRDCPGNDMDKEICNTEACPDGGWSVWSAWGTCSASCNGGMKTRTRACNNPKPSQLGRDCRGAQIDKDICNTVSCPAPSVLFSASKASPSSVSNGNAIIYTEVLVNTGDGYDPSTGVFTAPLEGVYIFSAQICTHYNFLYVQIVADGTVLMASGHGDSDFNNMCATTTAFGRVQAGARVIVKCSEYCSSSRLSSNSNTKNTFMGLLVN